MRANGLRLIIVISGAAVLAMAALATGLTTRFWVAGDEPGKPGAQQINQSAASTTAGITLAALSATFSGTETMLNFSATDRTGNTIAISVPQGSFSGDGFAGQSSKSFQRFDDGSYMLELPVVWRPGKVSVMLSEIRFGPNFAERVDGPWMLELNGPTESNFVDQMRVENFRVGTVDLAGTNILVTGRRSLSRTIIEYSLPPGLRELAPPTIKVRGETILALGSGESASSIEAIFPSTGFGEAVLVSFGPLGVIGETADAIILNLSSALQRAPGDEGRVSLTAQEVVGGRADLPLWLRQYKQDVGASGRSSDGSPRPSGRVDVIEIGIKGDWHPTDPIDGDAATTLPALFDSQGKQLYRIISFINYSKDAGGNVGEGQTAIVFWRSNENDLSQVTLVLGAPTRVVSGPWTITLKPS